MPRKRRDRLSRRLKRRHNESPVGAGLTASDEPKTTNDRDRNWFLSVYDRQYKKLLIIPIVMLLLAMVLIGAKFAITGDFINRGVTLKGGITLTVLTPNDFDTTTIRETLLSMYPSNEIIVRTLERTGKTVGFLIEADIEGNQEQTDVLLDNVADAIGVSLDKMDYSLEVMGSALGASFFKQTFRAIIIAFVFMALVVWYYFRIPVPSAAVILAAFSDMVVTLAIVNLMGMRLSTAGIAAFLMLIGYSVDTDILLSTRVLKRTEGTVFDRIVGAMKTGLTMNITTLAAVIVALVYTESEVLRQIMTILLIGLLVDIVNTWLQNAGILRWYLEKHHVELKKLD